MVKLLSFRLKQCFNPFVMLSVEGPYEILLFRHLSKDVLKMPKKIGKKKFFFEIIASELRALNCFY